MDFYRHLPPERLSGTLPALVDGVPALPNGRTEWSPRVVDWWGMLWEQPWAWNFWPSDVLGGLSHLALALNEWVRRPSAEMEGVVRRLADSCGLTPQARLDLEWADALEASPADIDVVLEDWA